MTEIVREFIEGQLIELVGWLSEDPVFGCGGMEIEVYADGQNLGDWRDVIGELQAFAGKRVRIVIEVSDA